MRILLVNDDGIKAKKLEITKNILKRFGTVITVAPSHEQSAKSMSLSFGETTYHKIDESTYSVEGTPVDCMNFALLKIDPFPDVVVSGTNNGYNIGIDIRYSGTLGAALQAQYAKIPSVAFSSDHKGEEILKQELEETFKHIIDNNLLSKTHTINVNFPRDTFIKSKGIRLTKVYNLLHRFEPIITENSYNPKRKYDWVDDIPSDSEQRAYLDGYTSISFVKL